MLLLSVYETFLYYCCLLLICRYILNCSPKKFYLYGSFIAFIPLVLIAISGNNTLHNIAYVAFGICQFLLVKIIFRNSRLRYIVFAYVLIFSMNSILISLFVLICPNNDALVDLVVNSITTGIYIFVCRTKVRAKIQQILEWTPRYILRLSSFLLFFTSVIAALVIANEEYVYFDVWNSAIKLVTIILLVGICIVFPVLMLTSISNNRLKSLTTNYEKQIEAQAKYYKELAAANHESRRFKHDFNNMRIAIEKLLADGENEQALQLIQESGNTMDKPAGISISFDTGNGIADALLTDKQKRAGLCNATIRFQGALSQDSLLPTDLCVILGNTLDNAIEACEKLPAEVEKAISITCNCSSGFLFLSICNPVAEKVVVNNNHITTTKENKTLHGFGLYSLNSVVKKYEGEVKLTATDDYFTVDIDLCLKLDKSLVSALPS